MGQKIRGLVEQKHLGKGQLRRWNVRAPGIHLHGHTPACASEECPVVNLTCGGNLAGHWGPGGEWAGHADGSTG